MPGHLCVVPVGSAAEDRAVRMWGENRAARSGAAGDTGVLAQPEPDTDH